MLVVDEDGLKSYFYSDKTEPNHCVFEFIYFSRPDSQIFNEYVDKTRRKLGKNLAVENPCDADIVISVPDSSNTAALGYAARSDAKFEIGLIRNHYVGRTFIAPDQKSRDLAVKLKLAMVKEVVNGKKVVVVDDSVVRGTTTRGKIRTLREAGAKQIHMRVSCPPIRFPCFYGIDFPTTDELLANNRNLEQIKDFLEVDSIGYQSLDGLLSCAALPKDHYCTACWIGKYPIPVDMTSNKFAMEHYQMHMFDEDST